MKPKTRTGDRSLLKKKAYFTNEVPKQISWVRLKGEYVIYDDNNTPRIRDTRTTLGLKLAKMPESVKSSSKPSPCLFKTT